MTVQVYAEVPATRGDWILEEEDSPYNLSGTAEGQKSIKIRRFSVLRSYSKDFKALCEGMARDSRSTFIYDIAKPRSAKDNSCGHCRAFYNVLQKSCRPPKEKRRRKKDKEAVIPKPPKQRLLHPEVVAVGGELFRSIVESAEEERDLVIEVYRDLIAILRDPDEDFSHGEREYASYLIHLLEAPIVPYEQVQEEIRMKAEREQWELQRGNSTFKLDPATLDRVFGKE